MPKKDIDFTKVIIYKIVCNDLKIHDLYVGYTTEFTKRKSMHKTYCNLETHKNYNLKLYQMIRDNGGWSNWSMIEIEKYPCTDSNEARARERYWYEILNANLNTVCPFLSEEEKKINARVLSKKHYEENKDKKQKYYEENRDKNLKIRKEYYLNHKEEHNQYMKEYRINHSDEIKEKRVKNSEEHKQYMKEYYKNNRSKILDDRCYQCNCDCGGKYRFYNKSKHLQSKKHLVFLNKETI